MQRKNKGVESSFKGVHLGKLTRPNCILNIYILEPQKLNNIDLDELQYYPENEINLSSNLKNDVLWNEGKKNIVSVQDSFIMNLGHLNPEVFYLKNKSGLKKSIKEISDKRGGKICFAVDCRNKKLVNVFEKSGIYTDTKYRVFSFSPFSFSPYAPLFFFPQKARTPSFDRSSIACTHLYIHITRFRILDRYKHKGAGGTGSPEFHKRNTNLKRI